MAGTSALWRTRTTHCIIHIIASLPVLNQFNTAHAFSTNIFTSIRFYSRRSFEEYNQHKAPVCLQSFVTYSKIQTHFVKFSHHTFLTRCAESLKLVFMNFHHFIFLSNTQSTLLLFFYVQTKSLKNSFYTAVTQCKLVRGVTDPYTQYVTQMCLPSLD